MSKKLSFLEYTTIASMLFGLFFGAGNLIFPVSMGQMAGHNIWPAIVGFLITGVGLPLLGVVAMGISRSEGLSHMASRVHPGYSLFFTCALYLAIGPLFAIPRTATVSYTVGFAPLLGEAGSTPLPLLLFSLAFFAFVLFFSLRPSNILTWVGKILNPIFLVSLGVLVIAALIHPMGSIGTIPPDAAYESGALARGFLEGYNTMDALAGLAFGIIVINVIRGLGVTRPEEVAMDTVKAGLFSSAIMAVIYVAITVVGTQSRGIMDVSANGGEALYNIATHYFGAAGGFILAVTVTFACLKTAVGLITACGETFVAMFPKGPAYKTWAFIFCGVSLLIANVGLTQIIAWTVPVLMFLYPLAITLILLSLFGRFFKNDPMVYRFVTAFTMVAAVFDFLGALPEGVAAALHLEAFLEIVGQYLPFFNLGLGWVCPAALGLIIGLIVHATHPVDCAL